jgi:hypothetical protein
MSGGVPPSSRARSRPKLHPSKEVQRAALLYERFSGHESEAVGRLKVPPMPRVAACVGECDGVLYTTVRDGITEKYIHKFAHNDKPLLCITPDGRQILLIGGRYKFTERGIVDNSDKRR